MAALSFVLGSSVPLIHLWWPSKESKRRERSITLRNNIRLYCEPEIKAHFSKQNPPFLALPTAGSLVPLSKDLCQGPFFTNLLFIYPSVVSVAVLMVIFHKQLGLDEPHAVSKGWQDVLEKQLLDVSYPKIERAESKLEEMHMEENDIQNNLQRKRRGHLLFFGITMGLLAEIINSRLFTNVWDSLGLIYDVSFKLNLFDRLKLGWYLISVTSTLGKDISCIKDLISQYEVASIEDLAYDQLKVDENSLYSCVGIPGAQAGNEITSEVESHEGFPGVIPMGRVLSTMSRPTASAS